jgi:hypothetical protein
MNDNYVFYSINAVTHAKSIDNYWCDSTCKQDDALKLEDSANDISRHLNLGLGISTSATSVCMISQSPTHLSLLYITSFLLHTKRKPFELTVITILHDVSAIPTE